MDKLCEKKFMEKMVKSWVKNCVKKLYGTIGWKNLSNMSETFGWKAISKNCVNSCVEK